MLKCAVLLGLVVAIVLLGRVILRPAGKKIQPVVVQTAPESTDNPTIPALRWPQGSEHIFAAPDPAWVVTKHRINPLTGQLFYSLSERGANIDGLWTDIRYHESGLTGLNDWRKLRRLDDKGRLRLEIDQTGDQRFQREFHENGTLAYYEHLRGDFRISGAISLDENGIELARVENGSGKLIRRLRSNEVEHRFLVEGITYLSTTFEDGKISKVLMYRPTERFLIDLSEKWESLVFAGQRLTDDRIAPSERWQKSTGKPPDMDIDAAYCDGSAMIMYFLDEKTQRRKQELASRTGGINLNGPRDHSVKELQRYEEEQAARAALRAIEYPKLRAEFLDRFSKYLQQLGTSIEAAGLSDVLKEPLP